ncbi:hypothetical protein [Mammaliicoccus sciuri]|nr:hypothetical protein [Mammaliicoccus sciuri]MBV5103427.1 hypothetical protein [Mammaliicoccus sciuri]
MALDELVDYAYSLQKQYRKFKYPKEQLKTMTDKRIKEVIDELKQSRK